MAMMYRLLIMGIASAILLAWIWLRGYRLAHARDAQLEVSGRNGIGSFRMGQKRIGEPLCNDRLP
jgi:hypothetical protein